MALRHKLSWYCLEMNQFALVLLPHFICPYVLATVAGKAQLSFAEPTVEPHTLTSQGESHCFQRAQGERYNDKARSC